MPQEIRFNTQLFYLASGSVDCGPPCSLISDAFMVPSAQWSLAVEQCFMKYCFCCLKAKLLMCTKKIISRVVKAEYENKAVS